MSPQPPAERPRDGSPDQRPTNRLGLSLVGVAVLAGAALLIAAIYVLSSRPAPAGAGRGAGPPPRPPAVGVLRPVVPSTDPTASALAWLRGYRTQAWNDPHPWSWVTRAAPVVTGSTAQDYRAAEGADAGQEWADYVARRCVTTVTPGGAVIPQEAPRSTAEAYVQVTGDALTRCEVGSAPGQPDEHLAATLELVRGTDGLWRVTNRLF